MDEREYNNVYAIPANYTDSGKLLGGMIDTRNAIETVILVLALGYPELILIPMPGTIRIVVMTVTLLPLAVVSAMGVDGGSLFQYIGHIIHFWTHRRKLHFRRIGYRYVIADSKGEPLAASQFQRVWQYVVVRSTKPRNYYKYVNGQSIKYTVTPTLGMTQKNQPKIRYTLDFDVTPHQLRHTYITNLLYAGVDPKTVQYLAGHENSKTTMDIYAKVKYNKPEELFGVVNGAFHQAIAE